jgi:hemerythrin-like domain-containing protein
MRSSLSAPADTRMMGIVHDALRRDLTRASDALSGERVPGEAQRVAIAEHIQALMNFLHDHHAGEDAWLWPTMRSLNPAASGLLDQMDADHLAISHVMEVVTSAAEAYQGSPESRELLVEALSELRGCLDPHLGREEQEVMPVVAATLTKRQYDQWEQEYYLKPKTKRELGMEGHWLIDSADRPTYDRVVGTVNPVLRFVLLHVFGPKYRQECADRWGTDVAVGPRLT